MEKSNKRRGRGVLIALAVVFSLIVFVPLGFVAVSFIGRSSPVSAIPEGFSLGVRVPRFSETLERLADHETVGEILSDPAFTAAVPLVTLLRDSSFFGKRALLGALNGELAAGLYPDGHWAVSFDTGRLSSFLSLLPSFMGRVNVPNLYYVQAGKLSRFEYRDPSGAVVYAVVRGNLLMASDSSAMLELMIAGPAANTALVTHQFSKRSFNAGILANPDFIAASLPAEDPILGPLVRSLSWDGYSEVTVSVQCDRLDLSVSARVTSGLQSVSDLMAKDSAVPALLSRLPASTQYETLLSAGNVNSLLAAYCDLDPRAAANLESADRASRLLFGIGLNELLFDWIGPDVAVFGLEGRPKPVFALQIADEGARKRAFDRLLSSVAVTGDDSTVLDGYRISRLKLPDFLSGLLTMFSVRLPSPYWIVDDGYFLASESPETLLAAVSSRRKGETLARNETWQNLAGNESSRVSASLFYTLDRSVPFFLKGTGPVQRVLGLYAQGCLSVRWTAGTITMNLSAVPGTGGGLAPIPGFPLIPGADRGGEPVAGSNDRGNPAPRPSLGTAVGVIRFAKKGGLRIVCVEGGSALSAYDPAAGSWSRYAPGRPLTFTFDPETAPDTPNDPSIWAVTDEGEVSLLDGNLKPVAGFPVVTGIRPTAKPAAFNGTLYLADPDSSLRAVSSDGTVTAVSMPFTDPIRSPPSFLTDGKTTTMAMYPKSFFSQVWLTDETGAPKTGWPQTVTGIAYGSPVLFGSVSKPQVAFITQAGDLFLFDGEGAVKPNFPARLEGVFYAQPVWDGAYLWCLSADGTLWRVSPEGEVLSQSIPDFKAEGAHLVSADADRDGSPEIFVTGDGNALYGYSASFGLLGGFPLAAWGEPWFGDLNGDGDMDCLAVTMDNTIAGWQFRKERK